MPLDFTTGNRDRLAGDCTGPLSAQPKYGIGHFGRRHQAPLRIVPRKLGYRLLDPDPLTAVADRVLSSLRSGTPALS